MHWDVKLSEKVSPPESTPAATPKEHFPEDTITTQVAAGDGCSFALTEYGQVYSFSSLLLVR